MTMAENDGLRRVLGVLVLVAAGVLLTSVGGLGIVAAPVTLPLLAVVVRNHPTRAFRAASAVIGGLTVAELTWGIVYFVAREVPVAIWMLPIAAGMATAFGFLRFGTGRRSRPRRSPPAGMVTPR